MRVGVYIDGYNVYYGGRASCGRGAPGWRWLDLRSLVTSVIGSQRGWPGANVERIVYCTARVDAVTNPSGQVDQDVYLKALLATGSVNWIEYGTYVARVKRGLLATEDPKTRRPIKATSGWPLMVRDALGNDVRDAQFMVSYLHLEEKGSDVNVASHLLLDLMERRIDAAVVMSNDSDLGLPVRAVRLRAPLGIITPRRAWVAGDLRGKPGDGVGKHWWRTLGPDDYRSHQLPDPAGGYLKPQGW